mmetsp:Transcript_201/g.439  ORF Transcript_201/g.439 Transcript_201/m.439 type:complete len:408 (+) Transcript_201:3-1226(+)
MAQYEPYIDVESVSLDPFLFDAECLTCDFLLERQTQLRHVKAFNKESGQLEAEKRRVAQKVGELSAGKGSFWVDFAQVQSAEEEVSFRDQVIAAAQELFLNVSPETKRNLQVNKATGKIGRGYLPLGGESGGSATFENKEGFAFGFSRWRSGAPDAHHPALAAPRDWNRMEAYNVWPSEEQSFSPKAKSVLERESIDLFSDLGMLLIRAYSLDLHGDETVLHKEWAGGDSWSLTRVFRYFKSLAEKGAKVEGESIGLGSSPHTDWGLLTFILASDEPGLQLSLGDDVQNETWSTVKPQFAKDWIFVNTGDFMALLSQGKYHSPRHRVVSPILGSDHDNVERTSIVHFYYPRYDIPIPDISPDMQGKYSTFTDQRQKADDSTASTTAVRLQDRLFGDWIAEKWTQVSR